MCGPIKTLNRMDEFKAGRGHIVCEVSNVLEDECGDPAVLQTNVHEIRDLRLFSLMIRVVTQDAAC